MKIGDIQLTVAEIRGYQDSRWNLYRANRPFDAQTVLWNVDTLLGIIDSLTNSDGFRAGVEAAAKVADVCTCGSGPEFRAVNMRYHTANCATIIAMMIRALLPTGYQPTSYVHKELESLLMRVGELTLEEGFSGHHQNGFEMFRTQMEAVIKARMAADYQEQNANQGEVGKNSRNVTG